eukprot:3129933-Prymnesium_polylepis.2
MLLQRKLELVRRIARLAAKGRWRVNLQQGQGQGPSTLPLFHSSTRRARLLPLCFLPQRRCRWSLVLRHPIVPVFAPGWRAPARAAVPP